MNASYGIGNETIDNYGHLGGLIYGFLFIFILVRPKEGNNSSLFFTYEEWRKYSLILIFVSLSLLIFIFTVIQKP